MIINEHDHTVQGSGDDERGSVSTQAKPLLFSSVLTSLYVSPTQYTIAGVLVGTDIRFIKRYVGLKSNKIRALKFVGKRIEPITAGSTFYQFAGAWGKGMWQGGEWMISTHVESNEESGVRHPIEGHW